jgi:hypothetical protein
VIQAKCQPDQNSIGASVFIFCLLTGYELLPNPLPLIRIPGLNDEAIRDFVDSHDWFNLSNRAG